MQTEFQMGIRKKLAVHKLGPHSVTLSFFYPFALEFYVMECTWDDRSFTIYACMKFVCQPKTINLVAAFVPYIVF